MAQSFSLQPLLELMQTRTDEATRQLGKLIAAEQNAKSRLQMLEQYREEYAQRLREATAQGITRSVLHNYQDFLARNDQATASWSKKCRTSFRRANTPPARRTRTIKSQAHQLLTHWTIQCLAGNQYGHYRHFITCRSHRQ